MALLPSFMIRWAVLKNSGQPDKRFWRFVLTSHSNFFNALVMFRMFRSEFSAAVMLKNAAIRILRVCDFQNASI